MMFDRHLGEPVDVRLAGAVVAALDRVVEQPVHAVAVVLVVLGRVDAALRGDRVRAPRRVVEREDLDVVAELAERRGGRRAGEAGADDDDVELPLVRRVDELDVELVVVPLLLDRPVGDVRVERHTPESSAARRPARCVGHAVSTRPSCTAIGNDVADEDHAGEALREAAPRALYFGLLMPRLWNIDHAPWYMWNASAMMARM